MQRNPICSLHKQERKLESDLVSALFHHLPPSGIWDQPNVICRTMVLCQLPSLGIRAALLKIGENGELILRRNELFWRQTSTQIKLTVSAEMWPHSPQPKCSTAAIHSPQPLLDAAGHFLRMNLGLQWVSSRTGKRSFEEETWTHGAPGEHMRMQWWRDEVSGRSSKWFWGSPTWRAVSEPCQGCMVFLINHNMKQKPGCWEQSLPGPAYPRSPMQGPNVAFPDFQSPSITRGPFSLVITTLHSSSGEIFLAGSLSSVML